MKEADEKIKQEEERKERLKDVGVQWYPSKKRTFDTFIAFDVETTGLDSDYDRIIELSAIKFKDGKRIDAFSKRVNPEMSIPKEITKITGIKDSDVAHAPTEEKVMKKFETWLGEAKEREVVMVAHNVSFDIEFLTNAFRRSGVNGIFEFKDTLAMARRKVPGLENYKLKTVAKHFKIIVFDFRKSGEDAEMCGKIFIELLKI